MPLSKYLDPKNDFAFKKIFGTEKHKDILIHFINDMVRFKGKAQIVTVSFLKNSQDPEVAAKKQSIVDVLCEDQHGRRYIVEMQVARTKGFEKRAQYYAAKAYVSQLKNGEKYHALNEIIFLAITDFVMFPDKKGYKSDHVILDRDSYEQDLKDFSYTCLELPKFDKKLEELQTIIEKWTYFFKYASQTSEVDMERLAGPDIVIRQAYEVLNQFAWSEEELDAYEREKKSQMDARAIEEAKLEDAEAKGRAKGREEGISEGVAKGRAEVREEGIAEGIAIGRAEVREEGIAEGVARGKREATLAIATSLLQQGWSKETLIQTMGIAPEDL